MSGFESIDALVARMEEQLKPLERERIAAGARLSLLDRLLLPLNKLGTKRFLAELEDLVADRVAELTKPGQVILQLAVQGFGVLLRP